jgi:hypothetical protein
MPDSDAFMPPTRIWYGFCTPVHPKAGKMFYFNKLCHRGHLGIDDLSIGLAAGEIRMRQARLQIDLPVVRRPGQLRQQAAIGNARDAPDLQRRPGGRPRGHCRPCDDVEGLRELLTERDSRTSMTLRLSCRFCMWRETTVWLTASSSAAARMLPVRPTASKARSAFNEGRRGLVMTGLPRRPVRKAVLSEGTNTVVQPTAASCAIARSGFIRLTLIPSRADDCRRAS